RIERGEPPVITADEQQSSTGCEYSAVTLLGPLIPPRKLIGRHVECSDDSGAGHACVRRRTAEITAAGWWRLECSIAASTADNNRRCTDEQLLLRGVVCARRPVCATPDTGHQDDRIFTGKRRKDAAFIDELITLRSNLYRLRHDGVAAWKRLRGGSRLPRL